MKIFQFFINPKLKKNFIFDCFCFEPKNIYEKRLGSLYIVGSLAFLKNPQILSEIAIFLKEKFYRKAALKPEKALKETLKEANFFLEEKSKRENLNLFGLNLAILNLKGTKLSFSKMGKMEIQLIRGKKFYDLNKKLKIEKTLSFLKIASGRLFRDDLILVENREVFDFLQKENFFKELEKMSYFEEKKLKKMFEEKKEKLKSISGILFALTVSKEDKEKKEKIDFEKEEFSLKRALKPLLEKWKKKALTQLKISISNKKLRLILIFIFFLFLGFLISEFFTK